MAEIFDISYFNRLRFAKPFKPFQIRTASGGSHDVLHPLWFGYNGKRIVVVPPGGGMKRFQQDEVVSVRHLTEEEIALYRPIVEEATRRRTG